LPKPPLFPYTTLFRSQDDLASHQRIRSAVRHIGQTRPGARVEQAVEVGTVGIAGGIVVRRAAAQHVIAMEAELVGGIKVPDPWRSEEHTSELQSRVDL